MVDLNSTDFAAAPVQGDVLSPRVDLRLKNVTLIGHTRSTCLTSTGYWIPVGSHHDVISYLNWVVQGIATGEAGVQKGLGPRIVTVVGIVGPAPDNEQNSQLRFGFGFS